MATRATSNSANEKLHILGIAGSLRRESYNMKLLREASRLCPEGMEISIYARLGDFPPFNEDVEREAYPAVVDDLKRAIERADGLVIATPEYNYGVPGVLKNALDWASRPPGESPLEGKPAAIIGASPGMGGSARAQLSLRNSFVFTQTPVLPGPEVLVTNAPDQFDENGRLTQEKTQEFLVDLLERFDTFVRRFADDAVEWSEPLRPAVRR